MKILEWPELMTMDYEDEPCVMTIGVFDGFHRGHRTLIKIMKETQLKTGLITFRENPKKILYPDAYLGHIESVEQKLEKIESFGISYCILIDFSQYFSKLEGDEFFSIILRAMNVKLFILGADFHCGNKKSWNVYRCQNFLTERSVDVRIESLLAFNNAVISSSMIREEIRRGNLSNLNNFLGNEKYHLDLRTVDLDFSLNHGKIKRENIHQVLPIAGEFHMVLVFPHRKIEARVKLDKTYLHWTEI